MPYKNDNQCNVNFKTNIMKTIQMVKIAEDNSLWIIDFTDKNELVFRTSHNPEHLQKEKIVIKGDMIYTNLYFFHASYIQKFLNENKP